MRAWSYGEAVSADCYRSVCARLFGKRLPTLPPHQVLRMLHERVPLRLDFEINRTRGLAFEAGEHGFTARRV